MDPKNDIKEDYVKPELVHEENSEPEKLPRLNSWQIVLLSFLFIFVVTAGILRSSSTNFPNKTTLSTTPILNQQNPITLVLGKLQFQLPDDWWYKEGKNEWYPIKWLDINPTQMSDPPSTVPLYTLRLDEENSTYEIKKQEIIKNWKLVSIEEKPLIVTGIQGLVFTGVGDPNQDHFNSRFSRNSKVKVALFIIDNEVYQLLGDTTLGETYYDNILSTFSFDQSQKGQFCGGFAGISCPTGFVCKYDGDYPDAGGVCVQEPEKCLPYVNPCDPQSCDYDTIKCSNQ